MNYLRKIFSVHTLDSLLADFQTLVAGLEKVAEEAKSEANRLSVSLQKARETYEKAASVSANIRNLINQP